MPDSTNDRFLWLADTPQACCHALAVLAAIHGTCFITQIIPATPDIVLYYN